MWICYIEGLDKRLEGQQDTGWHQVTESSNIEASFVRGGSWVQEISGDPTIFNNVGDEFKSFWFWHQVLQLTKMPVT
jgi:hypothetical protein